MGQGRAGRSVKASTSLGGFNFGKADAKRVRPHVWQSRPLSGLGEAKAYSSERIGLFHYSHPRQSQPKAQKRNGAATLIP